MKSPVDIAGSDQLRSLPTGWADLLLFKLSWAVLVAFQSSAVVPVLGIIALKVVTWPQIGRSLGFILLTAIIGLAMDLALTAGGVFAFPDSYFPLWLVLLWVSFALTLPRGFAFLSRLHPLVQSCVGMIAGSLGYYAGYLLGGVDFGYSLPATMSLIVVLWGIFIPFVIWLDKNLLPG